MSHLEKARLENEEKLISYQKYAFDLVNIDKENQKPFSFY